MREEVFLNLRVQNNPGTPKSPLCCVLVLSYEKDGGA